ncbi:GNAT family N-acetyltransferase [Rhizorhabdus dicambivorans]|uniref:N-acetyltransferase n=1 Tax=Rhizorhabdus dicambivorans TaxID=1850238 RepID=A0A2A4FZD3_9SPHN|nr:GNAT family N-acetyltransferase [Rhizorhabdus dicambivorans]ATE64892.1 N-acetyltransferase [Rhizorhabdus dicambivorans]PCE44167.1 N-acetyltransferase [Rhizorhabdus dicambivorans]
MTSGPVIRRAGPDDASALAMVGAATFLESYAHVIGAADMLAHIAGKNSPEAYRAFATDPSCSLWIAELPETAAPVGYALLTPPDLPIEIDDRDIELRRIYLMSKWQGSGLGRRLIEAAIDHARRLGKKRFLIGVYSGNEGVIGFYRRMGCGQLGTRQFQVGDAVFDDLVLGMGL